MASCRSSLPLFVFFSIFIIFTIPSCTHVSAELILEEGYTVTTVIDGYKLNINPHAVLSRPGFSDLILLDSFNSVFYTLSFPVSPKSVVKRLSGNGVAGLSDGELDSAQFNKPKSFAVDVIGNIYVADRINGTIRKITNSGVTTIAGGYSKRVGHQDGPAQNATFSSDFELAFVPQECALLISDHGNRLVRQIALKPDDCATASKSGLGMVSFWVLGLGVVFSCLLGMAIGFVVRPYITSHDGSPPLGCSETWKLFRINMVKPVLMLCLEMRSALLFCLNLSHLSLMFIRINPVGSQTQSSRKDIGAQVSSKGVVSLLDSDVNSFEIANSHLCAELKDLITFNGPVQLSNPENEIFKGGQDGLRSGLLDGHGRIDAMIQANIMGFTKMPEESTPITGSLVQNVGLVKRR